MPGADKQPEHGPPSLLLYEELPPISQEDAVLMLALDEPEAIGAALVRLALHEEDKHWVEELCTQFAQHRLAPVRQVAVICLGHLARVHGTPMAEGTVSLLESLLGDPQVAGYATDALDDLRMFAGDG